MVSDIINNPLMNQQNQIDTSKTRIIQQTIDIGLEQKIRQLGENINKLVYIINLNHQHNHSINQNYQLYHYEDMNIISNQSPELQFYMSQQQLNLINQKQQIRSNSNKLIYSDSKTIGLNQKDDFSFIDASYTITLKKNNQFDFMSNLECKQSKDGQKTRYCQANNYYQVNIQCQGNLQCQQKIYCQKNIQCQAKIQFQAKGISPTHFKSQQLQLITSYQPQLIDSISYCPLYQTSEQQNLCQKKNANNYSQQDSSIGEQSIMNSLKSIKMQGSKTISSYDQDQVQQIYTNQKLPLNLQSLSEFQANPLDRDQKSSFIDYQNQNSIVFFNKINQKLQKQLHLLFQQIY